MAYIKIITKAPEDVYGKDIWFIFAGDSPWKCPGSRLHNHQDGVFVDWSLLTDKEREACWTEFLVS